MVGDRGVGANDSTTFMQKAVRRERECEGCWGRGRGARRGMAEGAVGGGGRDKSRLGGEGKRNWRIENGGICAGTGGADNMCGQCASVTIVTVTSNDHSRRD